MRRPAAPRDRRLVALLAAAALAAFLLPPALGGAQGGLGVTASLAGCGQDGPHVSCDIVVGFGEVAGADRYSATVSKPDGSVEDMGGLAPGSTTLRVGYVGDGRYVVTVSAWDGSVQAESASARG